VIKTFFGKEA